MRTKLLYAVCLAAAGLIARNLLVMLLVLPDEEAQGAAYRIIFFHVPAAWTAFAGFFVALLASIRYLFKSDLRYDALAVAVTEAGLAFGIVNLVTGMIWGRVIWGVWWAWDPRLTATLVCCLLYAVYLMLRRAIEEPSARARISAVFSIFAFADVPIVFLSIRWWRTLHPQPVFGTEGFMEPAMWNMLFINWIPLLLLFAALAAIRMRQEQARREIEGLRRRAHTLS